MRSCLGVVVGVTLVVLAAVGWLARDEIGGFVSRVLGGAEPDPYETSARLAERAENKVVDLGQGAVDEIELSLAELNSWIEYGLKGYFPEFLSNVRTSIGEEERLVLEGRVITRSVPGIERMGPVTMFLGDTADVRVTGRVDGREAGVGEYRVEEVQVGAITLPDAWRDQLLAQLRARAVQGEANVVLFELPRFVVDVGVRDDRIVLRRAPVTGNRGRGP